MDGNYHAFSVGYTTKRAAGLVKKCLVEIHCADKNAFAFAIFRMFRFEITTSLKASDRHLRLSLRTRISFASADSRFRNAESRSERDALVRKHPSSSKPYLLPSWA